MVYEEKEQDESQIIRMECLTTVLLTTATPFLTTITHFRLSKTGNGYSINNKAFVNIFDISLFAL